MVRDLAMREYRSIDCPDPVLNYYSPARIDIYKVSKNIPESEMTMLEKSVFKILEKYKPETESIIVLDVIETDYHYRNRGYGSLALSNWLLNDRKLNGSIIVLTSGILVSEFPDGPPVGEDALKYMARQSHFFERHGFRNMSALCDKTVNGIPYIYRNRASRVIIEEIIKAEIARDYWKDK